MAGRNCASAYTTRHKARTPLAGLRRRRYRFPFDIDREGLRDFCWGPCPWLPAIPIKGSSVSASEHLTAGVLGSLRIRVLWLRREKEIGMRHLSIVGAAVVAALGINAGNAEAASAPLDGLATSGLPTIDVR